MKNLKFYTPVLVVKGTAFTLTTPSCGGGSDNNNADKDTPPLVNPVPDEVPASTPVAFIDVTVAPMTSEVELQDHTALTRDRLIDDMGPSDSITIPPDSVIIDGSNLFLIPGLADMHIHPLCSAADGTCFLGTKELENHASFPRAFRKHFGLSPKDILRHDSPTPKNAPGRRSQEGRLGELVPDVAQRSVFTCYGTQVAGYSQRSVIQSAKPAFDLR